MGSSPDVGDVEVADIPAEPEPVKRTDSEAVAVRNRAKDAAARKFGLAGTDVTQGALASETASTKKAKLGA